MIRYMTVFVVIVLSLGVVLYILSVESAFFVYYQGRSSVQVLKDIVYKEGSDNPKHSLDLYLPKDQKSIPMVYFVHGGNWSTGDKSYYQWITGLYGNIGVALAQKGIGVGVASYRLHPGTGIEGQVDDILDGVAFMQKNAAQYGGNGDIFLMGHSAGGHLVSYIAAHDSLLDAHGINKTTIRGYMSLSGVWDVNELVSNSGNQYNELVSYPLFGKTPQSRSVYSPLADIETINAPVLLAAGEMDYPYLLAQARAVDQKLAEIGKPHDLIVLQGYEHKDLVVEFAKKNDALFPKIVQFINQYGK